MSDKYGTVLLFYTGIVVLVLLMASGIERYQNRFSSVNQNIDTQPESDISIQQNVNVQPKQDYSVNQKIDTQLDQHIPRIALTFDDGPSYYTEELLDGLKERDVPASFFLVGSNIDGRDRIVVRMYEEGHLIGNHTYDHVQLTALPEKVACEQVTKTQERIREITGYSTVFVRPPYGLWPKKMEYCVTMIPVLWNIDSQDWTTSNVDGIVNKVVDSARDGGIILMLDCYDSSVQAALQIVDKLKTQGYRFVTVDELLCE